MYCEFELMKYNYANCSNIIQIRLHDDDDAVILLVDTRYHHKAYRFIYSSMVYRYKECLDFLTSNKLAVIYQTIKEPDMKNYKFPTIYKLKLTSKALMYAL
jgi:hypothetical protein